jgi:AraC-like DNA-binding protein
MIGPRASFVPARGKCGQFPSISRVFRRVGSARSALRGILLTLVNCVRGRPRPTVSFDGVNRMAAATVLASLTKAVIEYGVARGMDRARLMAVAQVDAAELDLKDARLPREAHEAVWRELSARLGPHGIGLDFAERAGPGAYGVVALRDMTADTFGEALRRHCRHHRLLKDDVSALLLETNLSATVFLAHPGGAAMSPAMAEAALAPYAIHARAWTGIDMDPEEVRFEHARPADVSRYERLFRCPVLFSQSATCIRFSRALTELPLVHAQRDVFEFLDAAAEQALSRLTRSDLTELVYRAVTEQLARGDASLASVARSLGIGMRTLQRRLKDDSVRYQDVVDTVRHHRALELLLDPSQPVAWISEHLGFSDPRAFRRAFARWTGMSPDRYRRGMRLEAKVA